MSFPFWKSKKEEQEKVPVERSFRQPYYRSNQFERKGYLWDILPDAKVPCRSIGEMRAYLTNTFEQWAGYPIVKFWIDNHEDTIWTWVETPRGRRKVFFGYIEDIAYNIQKGFYEPTDKFGNKERNNA